MSTTGQIREGFNSFYLSASLKWMRIGIAVGLVLFALFGIFDTLTVQRYIRFCIISPVLIICLYLTYAKIFKTYSQTILTLTYFVVSIGLVVMINYTESGSESREIYAIGLILCIIGTSAIR